MAIAPHINRQIVEALLETHFPNPRNRRLLLIHGRFNGISPLEFKATINGQLRQITVIDQHSVLGIVEVWYRHQANSEDDVLVIVTQVDDAQLGWDIRAHAVGKAIQTVDRVEILKQRCGVTDIDPRIRQQPWLVDALLEVEPVSGWQRTAESVLTMDAAVQALLTVRMGNAVLIEGGIDAATLLTWSQTATAASFAALPEPEQSGLISWLVDNVGEAAVVPMSLIAANRGSDVMALGVLGSVAVDKNVPAEIAIAFGGLLGVRPKSNQLPAFVTAVAGMLDRWLSEVRVGGEYARENLLRVVTRADQLAESVDLTQALSRNHYLPSGFHSRMRAMAQALTTALTTGKVDGAEQALHSVQEHALADLFATQTTTAVMAVRLLRWLVQIDDNCTALEIDSVAYGVSTHLQQWGWVDRALAALWLGNSYHDVVVAQAYQKVHDAARQRRERLDSIFAQRLAVWTSNGSPISATSGVVPVEDVLSDIVVPLAGDSSPLLLVLDGMSSAVAVELGEQLANRGWYEASTRRNTRCAAIAAIPSVTIVSRASLLTGKLTSGGQNVESNGFAAFWRQHHRQGTLFHKGEISGGAGQRLSEKLLSALASEDIVGVVLNTIDDALDHGREGNTAGWKLSDVSYLVELLDAAKSYGRPVIILSDHGHILDRLPRDAVSKAAGVQSARWRIGSAEDGEVELAGSRVLEGDGRIIAPWREDIRYLPRRAGYHGGASLAEMTIPILILLPGDDQKLPDKWYRLAPGDVTPQWWIQYLNPAPVIHHQPRDKPGKTIVTQVLEPLSAEPTSTLGNRIVRTPIYDAHRQPVRKGLSKPQMAAAIDVLVEGGGTRSVAAVASAAGKADRNPEFLVSILQRLLNVESYPILTSIDGGRTLRLDIELLCEQFGVRNS